MRKKNNSDFRGKSHEKNVDYSTGKNRGPGGVSGAFQGHSEHNLERSDRSSGGGGKMKKSGRRGY